MAGTAGPAAGSPGGPDAPLRIEPLAKSHDRDGFRCAAAPELETYLKTGARQDGRRDVAQTFVAVVGDDRIIGYYTLASLSIELGELPDEIVRKLPRYPLLPAALLGRLAVDDAFAGQGYGRFLLLDALHRAYRLGGEIGIHAVVTEPRDRTAQAFYERYDFKPFPERSDRLYLPMSVIRKLFS